MAASARRRIAANLLLALLALVFAAACDACDRERDNEEFSRERARSVNQANREARTVTPVPSATPTRTTVPATPPPANLRYATVAPITAVFDQPSFTTTYTVKVTGALPEGADFHWTGPNCGSVQRERSAISAGDMHDGQTWDVTFKWLHPHPPCANTTDHSDVTVTMTMSEGGLSGTTPTFLTTCTYRGSESGTGNACTLAR